MMRGHSMVGLAALILTALSGGAFAQSGTPAKGSPEHIRAATGKIDGAAIRANTRMTRARPSHGLDYAETRFSRLTQINADNVKALGLAWAYHLESTRGIEAMPLVVDGVMYVSASWSVVHAIDVRSGKRLWVYDPDVPREAGYKGCCHVVNRGVALYKGKVFVATYDGRLVALDAATGNVVWSKDTIIDRLRSYTPDTGKYVWRYQETPGDSWDFTSTQPMILADVKIDGAARKVILHAPKHGFFFVIDRTSGKLISAKNVVDVCPTLS